MNRLFWGIIALIGLLAVFIFQPTNKAYAAEGFNVITSPLPIKITTPPGKTVQTELRIKNQGDQAEGIKVGLMKFAASGTSGQPDLYDLTPKDTYASWVHFSPEQFTAQPNVWMSVNMTINVPTDADLGYYLAVTFSPAAQPNVPDSTQLKGSAATLVLLNVTTGNEKRSLDLINFSSQHTLYEYLPARFNVTLKNNGNIFVAPIGNIFITRGNTAIDTIDFNDAGGSVLPNSSRVFNLVWNDGFPLYVDRVVNGKPVPDNHDIPKQSLRWNFTNLSKFRFGKYTARLLVVYDNGKQDIPQEAEVSFWVLPWKIMLVILLVLVVIGFGFYSLIRSLVIKTKHSTQKHRRHGAK